MTPDVHSCMYPNKTKHQRLQLMNFRFFFSLLLWILKYFSTFVSSSKLPPNVKHKIREPWPLVLSEVLALDQALNIRSTSRNTKKEKKMKHKTKLGLIQSVNIQINNQTMICMMVVCLFVGFFLRICHMFHRRRRRLLVTNPNFWFVIFFITGCYV